MEFNEIYENEYPALSAAIATSNVFAFNKLLKSRKGLNVKDNRGRLPLHEAAEFERVDFVKALLKLNKDVVNCRSYEGETPLFLACKFHDNVSILRALVASGADVNIGNNEGITPLHIACGQKHCRVAVDLIELGADPNARDMNEFTPLHTAVENNIGLVTCLISNGANPSLQDIFGRTPLFLAVQYAGLPVIKSLLEANVDVNKPAYDGVTPLMMAAQRGILEHVDVLLENCANPNVEANDNLMAIHLALGRSGHESVVKRMFEVTDKTIISANIKKIPDYSPEFLALENTTTSYLSIYLESKQKQERMFQPIKITEFLREDGLISFECCKVVTNAKFTSVGFLSYFIFKFYASASFSEILDCILEHGCPVTVEDEMCYPPILAAVHIPNTEVALKCINIFVGHGVNIDYSSSNTSCPDILISAVKHSDVEVILCILKMTSFATLDDIFSFAITETCQVNKIIPLVDVVGGISPSVFKSVSVMDCQLAPSVSTLQTLCRTSARKYSFQKFRNYSITDICHRLQIPKLMVSYLKYENCLLPAM